MNDNIKLICPVCAGRLTALEKSFVCNKNHSFDIARQGYVNLLPVQNKHSLNPGDTKAMLLARREFLSSGKYSPICCDVADAVNRHKKISTPVLADVGCGEGYYTVRLAELCDAFCAGIDISKDGVRAACSLSRDILWLVSTASKLPFQDESVDVVTAMFSLLMPEEYSRVLKKGGCVIEVTVGSRHLYQLKEIIYDEVFQQDKHPAPVNGSLKEVECTEHSYNINLDNSQLKALLLMTPHFWRIRRERREMLENTQSLELTVHYFVRVLCKK